jgi:hypothetical protein
LSGLAGLWCLNLFSGVYGTTEVVPFPFVLIVELLGAAGDRCRALLDRTTGGGRPHMGIAIVGSSPDSRQTWDSLCGDREIRARTHQDVFEAAHEFDYAQRFSFAVGSRKTTEVEDRIAYDLAGAMKSDITATVAFKELNAALLEQFS